MRIPMTSRAIAIAFLLAACGAPSAETTPAANPPAPASSPTTMPNDIHALRVNALDGKPVDLSSYRGKVTLIVNVASECGYTPQYSGLQQLHAELAPRGFAVLGFPSNEFGAQEPGSPEQIRTFCTTKYAVAFPLFAKMETKAGPQQSPVYQALGAATGKLPNWNFCKYLVGKDGAVLGFYPSKVAPDAPELRTAIDRALQ